MNKNRVIKTLSLMLCSLIISSCGINPIFDLPPDEGMAQLYIYRRLNIVGSSTKSEFTINNKLLGDFSAGIFNSGYFKVQLRPGQHSVQLLNKAPLVISLRAGETIFLKHGTVSNTIFQMPPKYPSMAKDQISGLELHQGNYSVVNDNYISPEDIAWQSCKKGNNLGTCETFLANFGSGQHANQAANMIKKFKKDEAESKLESNFERDKQLTIEVRRDKYMIALTAHLKNENYQEAMQYFTWLERLNTKLAPSFNYFYGEALLKTGRPDDAITKFYAYIQQVGAKGKFYTKALELVNDAEAM